jgi:hypothetical protein
VLREIGAVQMFAGRYEESIDPEPTGPTEREGPAPPPEAAPRPLFALPYLSAVSDDHFYAVGSAEPYSFSESYEVESGGGWGAAAE